MAMAVCCGPTARGAVPADGLNPCWHGDVSRWLLYPQALAQKGIVMARRRQLYEGKAKILFEGPEPGTLVQYFKDDATAFNAQKKGVITGKDRKSVV